MVPHDVIPASIRRVPAASEDPDRTLPAVADPNDIGTMESEDDIQGLSRVINEIGGDEDQAKVIVWRMNPMNARAPLAWLDEISPAQFSIKWLADLYGGGLYNVRVFVPQVDKDGNKLNRVKCAANKKIYLEGAPKTKKYFEDPGSATAPGAVPGNSELATIVSAMMKSNENILAAIQANQAKPPDLFDLAEKFAKLKILFGGDQPKSSGMDQFREMLGMMKEIEETRAAGESGSSGMLMLLANKFMARFEKLEQNQSPALEAPADPAPVAALSPAADAGAGAGTVTRMVDTSEDDAMFEKQMMELYLRRLIGKAKAREDAKTVAIEVAQQADTSLFAFLETETWFDEIVKINANAALYKTFFATLRDEVLRLAKEGLPPEASGS